MIRYEREDESEVWKFRVAEGVDQVLVGPPPMLPVLFAEQNGQLYVWAVVTPGSLGSAEFRFHVVRTGKRIPVNVTIPFQSMVDSGGAAWHLFGAGGG